VKILDRYIVTNYLMGMFPVMLMLLALFSFVALADELEEVGKGTFSQIDAFLVLLYTSPRRIVDLMPVTALLGGLMGLGAMANHQELIAARAAGMSKARMARPVFKAVLMAAALVVFMQSLLIPVSERAASDLRSEALAETSLEPGGKQEFWTRSGENFVHVNDVLFNHILEDVEIYHMDAEAKLKQLIQAQRASIIGADTWLLEEVVRTGLDGMVANEDRLPSMEWQGLLSEEQANILILPLEALAPHDLVRYITYLQANDLDTHHFRVIFWQQISVAIAVLAMGLLSLPMLVGSIRSPLHFCRPENNDGWDHRYRLLFAAASHRSPGRPVRPHSINHYSDAGPLTACSCRIGPILEGFPQAGAAGEARVISGAGA